jgi:hypothetical protein
MGDHMIKSATQSLSTLWRFIPSVGSISAITGGFWFQVALYLLPAAIVFVALKIDHAEDIGRIRGDERAACAERIMKISSALNEEAERKIAEARKAAEAIHALTTPAEIADACAKDVMCIEHNQFKKGKSK